MANTRSFPRTSKIGAIISLALNSIRLVRQRVFASETMNSSSLTDLLLRRTNNWAAITWLKQKTWMKQRRLRLEYHQLVRALSKFVRWWNAIKISNLRSQISD